MKSTPLNREILVDGPCCLTQIENARQDFEEAAEEGERGGQDDVGAGVVVGHERVDGGRTDRGLLAGTKHGVDEARKNGRIKSVLKRANKRILNSGRSKFQVVFMHARD